MTGFNKDMSIEEILDRIKLNYAVTEEMHTGSCFFQYKLQQELLKDQREFQEKQLKSSNWLVYATWTLAIFTLILAIVTLIVK